MDPHYPYPEAPTMHPLKIGQIELASVGASVDIESAVKAASVLATAVLILQSPRRIVAAVILGLTSIVWRLWRDGRAEREYENALMRDNYLDGR